MAQAQLDKEIAEEGSEAAWAYQLNLFQFIKKDQDFFLSNNVDQKGEILPTKQSSFLRKRNSRKLYSAAKIKSVNF